MVKQTPYAEILRSVRNQVCDADYLVAKRGEVEVKCSPPLTSNDLRVNKHPGIPEGCLRDTNSSLNCELVRQSAWLFCQTHSVSSHSSRKLIFGFMVETINLARKLV